MKEVIEKLVSKHTLNLAKAKTLEDYAETENNFTNKLLEAINYTRCCDKLKDKTELNFELWLKENGYAITDEGYINNEITFSFGEMHKIYNDYLKTL